MLMRFDPFRELDRSVRQLAGGRFAPALPMDAYRQGDRFTVHFDLPGVDPGSIDLTVEKNVLTVRADRPRPADDGVEWLIGERQHGSFSRQLFLGESLDADRIEAAYADGVLTVTVPVADRVKARRVEVTTGSGNDARPAEAA